MGSSIVDTYATPVYKTDYHWHSYGHHQGSSSGSSERRCASCKKNLQAIRIAVNRMEVLAKALPEMTESLKVGGRLCVITFHSLEDRIVKQFIRSKSGRCTCPPGFPKCICNAVAELRATPSKPIIPSKQELEDNHRARSAKLRVAEKLI